MRGVAVFVAAVVALAAAAYTPPFPPQTELPTHKDPFLFIHLVLCRAVTAAVSCRIFR
jgi:hypothetical protein